MAGESAYQRALVEMQGPSLEEQERRRKLIKEDEKRLKKNKENKNV